MVKNDHQQMTHAKLERKVAELVGASELLKKKIENHEKTEADLRTSEALFHAVVDQSHDGIVMLDKDHRITYISPSFTRISGYEVEDIVGELGIDYDHPDDLAFVEGKFRELLQTPGSTLSGEYRLRHKLGHWIWTETTGTNLLDNPHVRAVVVNIRDITDRKESEEALQNKSRSLEKTNIALSVLLDRRDEEKAALESRFVANVKELVCPYVEKLGSMRLSDDQGALLSVIASNLESIISPFVQNLTTIYSGLTSTEIRVANFIKDGKRSKEIARLLNVGLGTVDAHRNHIRKKLGIAGLKVELRAHLLSL
jgi:PAS domain S-box-containing protein